MAGMISTPCYPRPAMRAPATVTVETKSMLSHVIYGLINVSTCSITATCLAPLLAML